ncbi:hypothetical protein [Streptomyces sp. NPDC001137]|uniref:hypothetical protein n=1 Tax=Streptomyces sp. NPDC001137 TaxID=3154378 RepID=UPI0033310417
MARPAGRAGAAVVLRLRGPDGAVRTLEPQAGSDGRALTVAGNVVHPYYTVDNDLSVEVQRTGSTLAR